MEHRGEVGISIITIVLNGTLYIEETILSVIEQPNINLEYIIIDGGSTDGTLDKISKYRDKIDIIISEPDKGIYHAINKGISLAKHDFIGLIHCGDFYEPGVLSDVVDEFLKTSCDVIYGDIKIIENNLDYSIIKNHQANHELLRKKMSIFHPSTFVKRECYEKNGLYNTNYLIAADYDLFLNLFLDGKNFRYIPKVLANFRGGGVSDSKFKLLFRENVLIRKKHQGTFYAFIFAVTRIPNHYFFSLRKSLFELIIGKRNFIKLKLYILDRQNKK